MIKKPKKLDANFVQCVPWNHIEQRWGKREYKRFCKWMIGQTCLREGAYLSDIQYYVEHRNRGLKHFPTLD